MAKPVGRSIESAVEDFSADDGARQDNEESRCFGSSRADAGVDNALQEDFDAGGVHEEGRYEVVAWFTVSPVYAKEDEREKTYSMHVFRQP